MGFTPNIFGVPVITHTATKWVQRRKHRKKRINKKWLKKYGMMKVEVCYLINLAELQKHLLINTNRGSDG